LEREVRLWLRLDHPNVLPLLGFFLEGTNAIPNLVSQWMINGTVTRYLLNRPFVVLEICKIVPSGLIYLHDKQKIVHSDLKGANILVSDDGNPLLADFGLSISSSTLSLSGTTNHGSKGSVRWMARELISVEELDHTFKTDIWSYGMVICELLTQKIPYSSVPNKRIRKAISEGELPLEPDFGHLANGDVCHGLWQICQSCWREVPSQRPSAQTILGAVEKLMNPI
ncbi:kinase-like protein, partial [Schizopora paradoxa]